MSFFNREEMDSVFSVFAMRLAKALTAKGKIKGTAHLRNWTYEFSRFAKSVTVAEIDKVLAWYEVHLGEEMVPAAHSAVTFCKKFLQIEAAMERSASEDCPISPRCRQTAEYLSRAYIYPASVLAVLPAMVQKSQDNWDAFCSRISSYETPGRNFDFLTALLAKQAPIFIDDWFNWLAGFLSHMKTVSQPMAWVFKPDSSYFKENFWRVWAEARTTNPRAFDELLDILNGKEKKQCS
jgi:hypothetical protein